MAHRRSTSPIGMHPCCIKVASRTAEPTFPSMSSRKATPVSPVIVLSSSISERKVWMSPLYLSALSFVRFLSASCLSVNLSDKACSYEFQSSLSCFASRTRSLAWCHLSAIPDVCDPYKVIRA